MLRGQTKGMTGCPMFPWTPAAVSRGGCPSVRSRRGASNLKNLFSRSSAIPGTPVHCLSQRGVVVQSVRMLACHAGGRGFESRPLRHLSRKARESGLSAFPGADGPAWMNGRGQSGGMEADLPEAR